MSNQLRFDPFPFLKGPHYQTIAGAFCNFFLTPSSYQQLIYLPDGDKISLEVTVPKTWTASGKTVVLVHGLCGSHNSGYLARMAGRLEPLGIRTVRLNMRGCGSGKGLAKKSYHSGRSDDVFEAIKILKKETPDSPIILIGFSLGGSIVLKMAGELGSLAKQFISKVGAVSPPVDLYSSVLMIGHEDNAIYEKYFYRMLRADVHYRHNKFKDLEPVHLPRHLKMYEFDQIYTAPMSGFNNVEDYYARCSSAQFIPEINVPCKILFSEDDPIVSSHSLDRCPLPTNIEVFVTKQGGHMGYLGHPQNKRGIYWLDSLLIDWITDQKTD